MELARGSSEDQYTDLWALGAKHDSAGLVWALLEGLSEVGNRLAMRLKRKREDLELGK